MPGYGQRSLLDNCLKSGGYYRDCCKLRQNGDAIVKLAENLRLLLDDYPSQNKLRPDYDKHWQYQY